MNLALVCTLARVVLALVGSALLVLPVHPPWALVLLIVAAITDFLDGSIARSYGTVTKLGAFLDPLADKILVLLYLTAAVSHGLFPVWMLLCTLARELVNDGLRSLAAERGVFPGAIAIAKWKTALQMVALIAGVTSLLGVPELVGVAQWLLGVSLILGWAATLAFAPRCLFTLNS